MSENTTPQQPATPETPAPRRRFTVQRGGCGCEGKPAPKAAAPAADTAQAPAGGSDTEPGEAR
ncbi:hypothetical protein [Streptomyces sp. S.PB5]|uniref:hypothetical protein n=1 Tax=Streptomyces sp. S.PB5 TaxID=3020844 RepID=UPI0025B101D7|nr:hypothetical protein [Streptomyces sp. S.PB5]MDN3025969.1 hypothetical protein [Streptomyces sp. S.PB5]